jgi:hypothetical protein
MIHISKAGTFTLARSNSAPITASVSSAIGRYCCKRFWVSEEATLIQDQPAIRKVDSKFCWLRFDCCAQAAPRRLLQQYRPVADARVALRPRSCWGVGVSAAGNGCAMPGATPALTISAAIPAHRLIRHPPNF